MPADEQVICIVWIYDGWVEILTLSARCNDMSRPVHPAVSGYPEACAAAADFGGIENRLSVATLRNGKPSCAVDTGSADPGIDRTCHVFP